MKPTLKSTLQTVVISAVALSTALVPANAPEGPPKKWTVDVSLYGLAAGMSGDVVVKGVPADVDVGFDKIWDNLEMGGMGKVRIGYEKWAFTTDVIYMGLGGSKDGVSADLDQWVVEPSLSYTVYPGIELLAGARYNSISAEIRGPLGGNPSGTEDWWDPIVGTNVSLPLGEKFSFSLRGDVGGFGIGSDLTWQAFPFIGWHFAEWGSVQAGYRWVYTDYETGSGTSRFKYDMLTQGPQVGFTAHF